MSRLLCFAVVAAAFAAMPVQHRVDAAVSLVDAGQSEHVIVLGRDASASERFAARELADHLREISGATLPVVEAPDAIPARAIFLGESDATRALGLAADEDLGEDGFILRTVDDHLLIVGARQRGTMYGVYELLHELGVRWWTPGESTIPNLPTIAIDEMDRRVVPALARRNIMYFEGHSSDNHIWFARNRLNGAGWSRIADRLGGDTLAEGVRAHNAIALVRESVDEIHDDMWAQIDGRPNRSEICPSHDANVQATIRSLARVYEQHPYTPFVVLSHEDNNTVCRCDRCSEISQREGDSGLWWQYVNRIAEGLEQHVPGAELASGAYLWTRPLPNNIRVRDNVIVRFAPIETNYARPLADRDDPANVRVVDDIRAWHESGATIAIWNYVGNRAHYLMPNPDLHTLVPNIRFFVDHGAVDIMKQGTHAGRATEFVPLRMWVLAQALWNPDADGDELIDEFLEGYYGPAAPALRRYIDHMHTDELDYHLGRVTRMNVPFIKPDMIARAEAILRDADQAVAGDADLERRVRHAHMPIWYVLAKRGPLSRTWQATEQRVGELDFAHIAPQLDQVRDDWNINAVADPEYAEPFFAWLTDYGRLAAGGPVLPPELDAGDLERVRLLQARQIDSGWLGREGWWVRDDAASDGWALRVPVPRWLIQHHFSPYEEAADAERFRLFVRVRAGEAVRDAELAFVVGTTGGVRREVRTDETSHDAYQVFEVGEFNATDAMFMYIALSRPSAMDEVLLDALWLEPLSTASPQPE